MRIYIFVLPFDEVQACSVRYYFIALVLYLLVFLPCRWFEQVGYVLMIFSFTFAFLDTPVLLNVGK